MTQTTTPVALLSPNEVAATLAISRRGVYRLRQRGELPAIRVGGVLRFTSQDLSDYISRQRTERAAA